MELTGTAPLTPRGTTICRGCLSPGLTSLLDLGLQPLANEFPREPGLSQERFPLHLKICPACGLGQVGEFVPQDRIFSDYPYLSSASTSWLEHAEAYAEQQSAALRLGEADLVLEVASNDGYLLAPFQRRGVRVLGVEPARNVAAIAVAQGVPTVTEFFGQAVATGLLADYGHPRLIAANNVMAHVPDLQDFTAGFGVLAGPDTVVSVENPSFLNLLVEGQFDTIYHEHFSYLTAHAVSAVAQRHGLTLFDVEQLDTHGGSNRYLMCRAGVRPVHERVAEVLAQEFAGGLFDAARHEAFADGARRTIDGLRAWFGQRRANGVRVAGYGAAAKGNTLLNATGATSVDLVAVADASVEKQGRFLPGTDIPVVAPDALAGVQPDAVLILPWNLQRELVPLLLTLVPGRPAWIAVPDMKQVSDGR